MRWVLGVLLVTALAAPVPARAQALPPVPTFKTDTTAIVVDVIVRDKKGRPVTDLAQAPRSRHVFEAELPPWQTGHHRRAARARTGGTRSCVRVETWTTTGSHECGAATWRAPGT